MKVMTFLILFLFLSSISFSDVKNTTENDTEDPIISNVSILNRTFIDKYGENSKDSNNRIYVKDGDKISLSYDVKESNLLLQEMDYKTNGGYLLDFNGYNVENIQSNIVVSSNKNLVDTYTISYFFTINDSSKIEKDIDITLKAQDKAGNIGVVQTKMILANTTPKELKLELYEEVKGWENITSGRDGELLIKDGYKFTKGGRSSRIIEPKIFVKLEKTEGKVKFLHVEKISTSTDYLLDILGQTSEIVIDKNTGMEFGINTKNSIKVTPISISGVEGESKVLKFIVDTKINTSYLNGGIIGELLEDKIKINLSAVEELAGVGGYSYKFLIGDEVVESKVEKNLNGRSFVSVTGGSVSEFIEIDTSLYKGGSRGNLIVVVWDRLGNEKKFVKSYLIQSDRLGIKATIEEESKERQSKLKIIGEGEQNQFEVESNINTSKE